MVGTGIAASFGVLIKGGDILEKVNGVTTVVFDKTGTLTAGRPEVTDLIDVKETFKIESQSKQVNLDFNNLLEMLFLCESTSEHPLAKAIVQKAE